ncbi:unnamed protein product [Miscanthus lutarioriparius]|uniref:Uncharacterized protein n=1 Tax=Miscanthus lutarioriparius TaxID=422564 RepID=A0A811QVR0_9POAL|nr:unnamed protein product [Miscanthus lutarioriparius]
MASFAAQFMDMFFMLIERVTGYGGRAEDQKDTSGAQEPTKLTSDVSENEEEEVVAVQNIQIRARGGEPFVQDGSMPQVAALSIQGAADKGISSKPSCFIWTYKINSRNHGYFE